MSSIAYIDNQNATAGADDSRPLLIFFTELGGGSALLATLRTPGALEALRELRAAVAVALTELDTAQAEAVRLLMSFGIPLVAWLCLPAEEGLTLSLANYPRAAERYQAMRLWAQAEGLSFHAVGLAIEPQGDLGDWSAWRAVRSFARGLWLARDNALYPAAREAYVELITTMRHDGYEVHTYQLPFVADDRRAGTTLIQRALDIADLPSDVDVLLCSSDVPIDWLQSDLGGALLSSYGPSADALGVGAVDIGMPGVPDENVLPWPALRRDLLLAAAYTDTIYVASLEHCVRAGLLPHIAALTWEEPAHARLAGSALIGLVRAALFAFLLAGRHWRGVLAWSGWIVALVLWLRRPRGRGTAELRNR
jgi:hypothetical protein